MAEYNSNKFKDQAKELYQQALKEAKEILKNNESGSFIAIPDYEDEVISKNMDNLGLEIWAVGVNKKDHIVIKAYEDQPGDCSVEEWHDLEWIDIEDDNIEHKIEEVCYPDLYRFVVDNLESATSQEEADEVAFDFE